VLAVVADERVVAVVGPLEFLDVDVVADLPLEGLREVDEPVGREPALGDEGVLRRREREGCLPLLDLDGELLLGGEEESPDLQAEVLEVRLDRLELGFDSLSAVLEFGDVLRRVLRVLGPLGEFECGELHADELVLDRDVGRCDERGDGLVLGEDLVGLDLLALVERLADPPGVALADGDRDVVVPGQQVQVDAELDERVDGVELLFDRPEFVLELVPPVVQVDDLGPDPLEFVLEGLVRDHASGPGVLVGDVEDRLQRADGDERLRGRVGALDRVARVEAGPLPVVVGHVEQVELVGGLDDVVHHPLGSRHREPAHPLRSEHLPPPRSVRRPTRRPRRGARPRGPRAARARCGPPRGSPRGRPLSPPGPP